MTPDTTPADDSDQSKGELKPTPSIPKEIGGAKGPEPTRYGDWEKNGRCCDF
ncbi:MAG: DUF1674 domain-containing protein [Candidatus Pacebacteria bacterium]|nr:DUF1674 domain-containing protein [Candidatus Paceibacterota bacterium]